MAEDRKVVKLKLNDGQIYSIFDTGAIHLNDQGRLVTGNFIVDNVLIDQDKFIIEINDLPVDQAADYYLVQQSGSFSIQRRQRKDVLKDIGGASYDIDAEHVILQLQVGVKEET